MGPRKFRVWKEKAAEWAGGAIFLPPAPPTLISLAAFGGLSLQFGRCGRLPVRIGTQISIHRVPP